MKKISISSLLLTVALASSSAVMAAEHEIKMLNKGADGMFVFEPGFLKIAKGDTVKFVATDTGHFVASVVTPDNTEWKSAFNKDFKVTFAEEGVVVYNCPPHASMGMIGVIQVGAPTNLDAAKKAASSMKISMNKERVDKYLGQVK